MASTAEALCMRIEIFLFGILKAKWVRIIVRRKMGDSMQMSGIPTSGKFFIITERMEKRTQAYMR